MDRRSFLRGAAAVGVLVPAGFAAATVPDRLRPPPPDEYLHLEDDELFGPVDAPIESQLWTPGNFDVALYDEVGYEIEAAWYSRQRGLAAPPHDGKLPIKATWPIVMEGYRTVARYALFTRERVTAIPGLMLEIAAGTQVAEGRFDRGSVVLGTGNQMQLDVELGLEFGA